MSEYEIGLDKEANAQAKTKKNRSESAYIDIVMYSSVLIEIPEHSFKWELVKQLFKLQL